MSAAAARLSPLPCLDEPCRSEVRDDLQQNAQGRHACSHDPACGQSLKPMSRTTVGVAMPKGRLPTPRSGIGSRPERNSKAVRASVCAAPCLVNEWLHAGHPAAVRRTGIAAATAAACRPLPANHATRHPALPSARTPHDAPSPCTVSKRSSTRRCGAPIGFDRHPVRCEFHVESALGANRAHGPALRRLRGRPPLPDRQRRDLHQHLRLQHPVFTVPANQRTVTVTVTPRRRLKHSHASPPADLDFRPHPSQRPT